MLEFYQMISAIQILCKVLFTMQHNNNAEHNEPKKERLFGQTLTLLCMKTVSYYGKISLPLLDFAFCRRSIPNGEDQTQVGPETSQIVHNILHNTDRHLRYQQQQHWMLDIKYTKLISELIIDKLRTELTVQNRTNSSKHIL